MPGLFEAGDTLADIAKDEALGGVSAGAGRIIYERIAGKYITGIVGKSLGKYTDVGSAFLFGVAVKYLAKNQSGVVGQGAQVAAYTPLGDAIGVLAGDAPSGMPSTGATVTRSSGYGGLSPVSLTRGAGGTTSVR